jgi:hypothetical protein
MVAPLETGVSQSLILCLTDFNFSQLLSARPWEESAPDPEMPNPVTTTKPPLNAGPATKNRMPKIRNVSPIPMSHAVKKRVANRDKEGELHLIVYAPFKQWPMGELAEMACGLKLQRKHASKYKKAIHPKPSDLGLWKKGQEHYSRRLALLPLYDK